MAVSINCPDCGVLIRLDPNVDKAFCPNRRTCGGEIDINEYRRSLKRDDFPKARGN